MSHDNLDKSNKRTSKVKDWLITTFKSNFSRNSEITLPNEEERVQYDEITDNGFVFNDNIYIPEEVLLNLLSRYVDYKTLCSCQSVCKQWNFLIKNYVWHKKAELMQNHTLLLDENTPWTTYYWICHKRPLNRNLIKNHSGQKMFGADHDWKKHRIRKSLFRNRSGQKDFRDGHGSDCDWKIISDGGHGWAVEAPPQGVPPLPNDPVFDGTNSCFVNSYSRCWKEQVIDLVKEGASEHILDNWQPTIRVSEWFSSHKRCGSVYACTTELLTEENIVLSHFNYSNRMSDENLNTWFKFEHEFKNYGKGLRKVKFCHGGQDTQFWAGHFGSKMSGACIKIEIPEELLQVLDSQEQPFSPEPYYSLNNYDDYNYDSNSDSDSGSDFIFTM